MVFGDSPNNMAENIFTKIFQSGGRAKAWRIFVLIILLALVASLVDAGFYYNKGTDWLANKTGQTVKLPHTKEFAYKLGLDLAGGTRLVYNAKVDNIPDNDRTSAVEGARDVIERRVNIFGVAEPLVQVSRSGEEYHLIVELAGIKDVNEAIKYIGETPLLEFKEQKTGGAELSAEQKAAFDKFNREAENKATDVLGKVISGGDFAALAKDYSEDEATKENGGDLGWITEKDNSQAFAAIKNLTKGKTTDDLVRTNGGFEIYKLEDRRTKTDPFTNVPEKEVSASHILICYKDIANCSNNLTKEESLKKIEDLKKQVNPKNFTDLAKKNSTEPGADQSGGDLGWFGKGMMVKPFEEAVMAQKVGTISDVVETEFGYHLIYKKAERNIEELKASHILIKTKSLNDITGKESEWQNTELTGKYLKRASVQYSSNSGAPEVSLEFDDQGAQLFEEITGRNVGKPVAIFLDNYPISIPNVNEKITGGKAVISGTFNLKEAKLLAQRLNAGALPVPINLINQQTVGASLGRDSLVASLEAGLYAFLFVALFMILFYRFPGFLAVVSLVIYSILALAIFKSFGVTLSLSGIAGFIISIGMAVDANVLIFARLREELKKGQPLDVALEESFRRAWPSIRDSNLFTIITCIILILFTTSVVKGFAVTLIIGVVVSMFSAIVVTRNFLRLIPISWLEKRNWLIGVHKEN
jgi:protein-export membrane protein SecD